MASRGRFEYTIGFKTDDSGLKQAKKALQEIQNMKLKPDDSDFNNALLNAKDGAAQLEQALMKAYNVKLGTTDIVKLKQELSNLPLKTIQSDLAKIGPQGEAAFNSMAVQSMKVNTQVRQGNVLLEKFGRTLFRNLEWLISGNIINTVTGVFTKAYGYTKSLDSSLNDIRIVTSKSADEMARFGREAQKTAAELGQGTTDITKASLIYFQQGLDTEEVNARTEVTAKMANVTKQSTDTTADQLTAIWNGFQVTNDELERYADIITKVAASTASSSSELSGAMSKVASVAKTTGVDMEQLTAMMSTVISVTRESPETVGTAFKTIFARMDDLVEDGTDEFGVSLGRISSHLKAMGIEILNEDGSLRSLGDTLTETGNKWSAYSREQQVAIAEQLGGKRQWNQVIALFDNWDKYSNALDTARNSAGALQEQQDIYMESTAAHLQAIKTAWEGVYGELMNPKQINSTADTFVAVLKNVQGLVEQLGGGIGVIGTVGSMLLGTFSDKIADQILRISNNFKIFISSLQGAKAAKDISNVYGGLTDSSNLQTLVSFNKAALAISSSMTKEEIKQKNAILDTLNQRKNVVDTLMTEVEQNQKIVNQYDDLRIRFAGFGRESLDTFTEMKDAAKDYKDELNAIKQNFDSQQSVKQMPSETALLMNQRQYKDTGLPQLQSKLTNAGKLENINNSSIDAGELKNFNGQMQTLYENYKNYSEQLKQLGSGTVDLKKLDETRQAFFNQAMAVKDLGVKISDTGKATVAFSNGIVTMTNSQQELLNNTFDLIQAYDTEDGAITKIRERLESMHESNAITQKDYEQLKTELESIKTTQDLDKIPNILDRMGAACDKAAKDADKMAKALNDQRIKEAKTKYLELQQAGEQSLTFLTEQRQKGIAQGFVQIGSGISQATFAAQSLGNVMNTLSDENASFSQKLTGVIMLTTQLGRTLTTITGGTHKFVTNIINGGSALKSYKAALGAKLAALKANIVMLDTNNAAEARAAAMQILSNTLSDKQVVSRQALVDALGEEMVTEANLKTAKEGEVIVTQALINRINELIKARQRAGITTGVQGAATIENTIAQEGNILATIKNALSKGTLSIASIGATVATVGLTAAVAALTVALFAGAAMVAYYSKQNEKYIEKQKETIASNDKLIDSNNEIINQYKEIQRESDSWSTLWDGWEYGVEVTDAMKDSLTSMVDALEANENGSLHLQEKIAQLTGNYTLLNQEIQENIRLQEQAAGQASVDNVGLEQQNLKMDAITAGADNQNWAQKIWSTAENIPILGGIVNWAGRGLTKWTTGTELKSGTNTAIQDAAYLKEMQKIYGSQNVDTDKEGNVFIDYANAAKNMTSEEWVTVKDKERQFLEEQKQLYLDIGETGSEAYKQISAQLQKVDNELQGYNEAEQAQIDTTLNLITKEDFKSNPLSLIDEKATEKETAIALQKIKNQTKVLLKQRLKSLGIDIAKIEPEKLNSMVTNHLMEIFPDKKDIIAKGEQYADGVESARKRIEEKIKTAKEHGGIGGRTISGEYIFSADEINFSSEDLQTLKQAFVNNIDGLTMDILNTQYDLSNIDGALLQKIFFGQATKEDFKNALNQAFTPPENLPRLSMDLHGLSSDFEDISKKIQKGSLNGNNVGDNKAFGEMQEQLNNLQEMFPDNKELAEHIQLFNDTAKIGTQEYIDNLQWLQEYINKSPIEALNIQYQDVMDKWQNVLDNYELTGKLNLDAEEFEEDLNKLLSFSRQVDVEVRTKIIADTEEIKTKFDNFTKQFSKIGEGFIVAADDLKAFQDVMDATDFSKLLSNAQVMAEGTIKLNEQEVNNAVDAAKDKIKAEYEFQKQKLEVQKNLLKAKDAVYADMQKEISAVKNNNKEEVIDETKLKDLIADLNADLQKIKIINEDEQRIASDDIKKKELQSYASFYTQVDAMDAEWAKKREQRRLGQNVEAKDYTYDYENFDLYAKYKTVIKTDGTKITEPDKLAGFDQDKVKAYLQSLYDDIQNQRDDISEEIGLLDSQIDLLDLYSKSSINTLNNLKTSYKTSSTEIDKNTDAVNDNTKAQEDNAEVKQELIDLLNKEIDAYHDVNQQINRHTTALNRLQKAQSKAAGKTLIKNLQDQIKALDDLNTDYAEKQRLQYEEAALKRVQLEKQGITFNDDGTIANYSRLLNQKQDEINRDVSWYNSLSGEEQESRKDWIKERQEEYESVVDLITGYDKLWNQDIPNLADSITENIDKQIEIQLSVKKQEVEITIEQGSLQRAQLDLEKTLGKVQTSDIAGNLAYDINVLFSYQNSGEIEASKKHLDEMKAAMEEYWRKGQDPDKRIQDAYKEALESYTKAVQEMNKRTEELVSSSFERLNNKIERQKAQFEAISKIFEHDMNLIKLRYGDKAYAQLQTLYEAKERLAQSQLSNANLAVQSAREELRLAQEQNLGDDFIQTLTDKLNSALENQSQAIENHLNVVKERVNNTVDAIFEHLDEQIAGVSLDKIKTEWDSLNDDSENYYDAINGAYEIEKLRNKIKQAVNETDDPVTQKAYNDLMNDQIKQLQQKDKLSKYDLERANALFDIEQKRAAFREAQNNKTKMRLRRDASGNYSYQFVSDEDRITSTMQDLADAQNSLYNIDKDAYKNNLDSILGIYEEYQQAMKDAANLSEEERLKIQSEWLEKINKKFEENANIEINLKETTLNKYEDLTGQTMDTVSEIEKNAIITKMNPLWSSHIATIARSGEEGLKRLEEAGLEAFAEYDNFNNAIDKDLVLSKNVTIEDIVKGEDPTAALIESMIEPTQKIADEMSKLIEILQLVGSMLADNNFDSEEIKRVFASPSKSLSTLSTKEAQDYNSDVGQTSILSSIETANMAYDTGTNWGGYTLSSKKEAQSSQPIAVHYSYGFDEGKVLDYLDTLTSMGKIEQQFNQEKIQKLNEILARSNNILMQVQMEQKQKNQSLEAIPVNIYADFPAVTVRQEIEEAFANLQNIATQRAFRTIR